MTQELLWKAWTILFCSLTNFLRGGADPAGVCITSSSAPFFWSQNCFTRDDMCWHALETFELGYPHSYPQSDLITTRSTDFPLLDLGDISTLQQRCFPLPKVHPRRRLQVSPIPLAYPSPFILFFTTNNPTQPRRSARPPRHRKPFSIRQRQNQGRRYLQQHPKSPGSWPNPQLPKGQGACDL